MSIERDIMKYIYYNINYFMAILNFHLFIEKPREFNFIDIFRYSLRPERSIATEEGKTALSAR